MPTDLEVKKQEDRIQQEMVMWYNNTLCLNTHAHRSLIFHVPNQNQYMLTGIGVLSGVSDLIVVHRASPLHRGVHIYVEVKTPTGKQAPKQKEFQQRITELGYEYYVVRSLQEFQDTMRAIHKRIISTPADYAPPEHVAV